MWKIVLVLFFVGFGLGAFVGVTVNIAGSDDTDCAEQETRSTDLKRKQVNVADTDGVWLRDEFTGLVMHQTPEEVLQAVGRPDGTQERGMRPNVKLLWYYEDRVRDPITGKLDSKAQVVFENGKVVRVNY